MNAGFDEADAGIFGAVVVFFVILAKGSDIHIKHDAVQITFGMFFGDHGILAGVHAAHR